MVLVQQFSVCFSAFSVDTVVDIYQYGTNGVIKDTDAKEEIALEVR